MERKRDRKAKTDGRNEGKKQRKKEKTAPIGWARCRFGLARSPNNIIAIISERARKKLGTLSVIPPALAYTFFSVRADTQACGRASVPTDEVSAAVGEK